MDKTNHRFIRKLASNKDLQPHLIITAPPAVMTQESDAYWTSKNKSISSILAKGKAQLAFEAQHNVLDKGWSEAYERLRTGGYLCIIVKRSSRKFSDRYSFYDNASRITYACQKIGFDALPSIKWRKPSKTPPHYMGSGMLPAGAYVVSQHDDILIFRKGAPRVFEKEEQDHRSQSALFCKERNDWYLDHWSDIPTTPLDNYLRDATIHHLPSELYIRMMMMYSIQGDTVLDPYGDNLLTSIAGAVLGRHTWTVHHEDIETSLLLYKKRQLKALLHDRSANRIIDHLAYAKTKDGLLMRYKNKPLGLPVQTTQEKNIQNYAIQSIKRLENEIIIKYRNWKKTEVAAMLKM